MTVSENAEILSKPAWNRRFVFSKFSHLVASGFGAGLSPIAPGTVGTLWAWVVFLILDPWLSDPAWAVLLLAGFALGIWACDRTGRNLGVLDHGGMVWDEVIAFWLVLWVIPSNWLWQLLAFGLFRFFDAAKPQPVKWADLRFQGGLGVMFDDLVAAFMTLIVMAFVVTPWWSRIFSS